MNKLTIIGNLTKDPETRTTQNGNTLCTFTVAVSRRNKTAGQPDTDYFRVAAWNALGEICGKYLLKGRKVCVVGPVALRLYETQEGEHRGSLEMTAQDVEFLSPKEDSKKLTPVQTDDNPFTEDVPY